MATALLASGLARATAGEGDAFAEAPEDLIIGTVIQRPLDPQEGRFMRDGGIGSVRFWLSWSAVETERGEYDWWHADAAIREIAGEGLVPMPFLFGTPAWAARGDGYECADSDCASFAPASIASRQAFARFAGAAVRRYGPGGDFWENNPGLPYRPITLWQLWNEPNLQSFWRPYANAAGYAALVQSAAAEIRAEDADAEILLGGLSGKVSTSRRWSTQTFLRHFYAVPGIAASFDGISIHPYDGRTRGVLHQIRAAHEIASKRDPDFDLWITEIGWASAGSRQWNLVKTPNGQARMLRRVFTRLIRHAAAWDLRGAYWYAWRDTERGQAVCGWCGAAGLRNREGDPKPAYDELRLLATD